MSRWVRQNVRNFLCPMTVAEAQRERDLLLERGDTVGAGYADEFIRELEADLNDGEPFAPVLCEGCYCDPCVCLPDDHNCDPM